MKLNHNIFSIAYALIITSSCIGMETIAIKKPKHIAFTDNNTIAVGGENGCGIFDVQSQKLIHKLTSNNVSSLVANENIIALIHHNKTKKTSKHELIVFDKETGNQLWLKDGYYLPYSSTRAVFNCGSKLAISPTNTTLFISSNDTLITYDYIEQKTRYTDKSFNLGAWPSFITCHPTENTLLYSDSERWLYAAEIDHELCVNLSMHVCPSGTDTEYFTYLLHTKGQYSGDGSVIAFNTIRDEYFICNIQKKGSMTYQLVPPAKRTFIAASFHPRASILALLSDDYVIHYCDYKSCTPIAETYPVINKTFTKTSQGELAFSPNGAQLAFSSKNQWSTIQTPDFTTNFAMICALLKHRPIVPKTQIELVIKKIAQLATKNALLSYSNLPALLKVTPLTQNPLDPESVEQLRYKVIYGTKKLKV